MREINQNPNFGTHNTSVRLGKIQYIVIHYVGATGGAEANVKYYNQPTTTNASADFYVGHNGEIWQYNPDPQKRYCWAVGGKRQADDGGSLYGIANNSNCVSIEMCVRNSNGNMSALSNGWYFEKATVDSTVDLTKYLMQKYGIDVNHVIRHYDVNGKRCLPLDNTELLTKDGWIALDEVNVGDMIATYDPKNDGILFDRVLDVVEPYETQVLRNRNVEATANHNMYVVPNCSNSYKFRDVEWGTLLNGKKQYVIKNSAKYDAPGLPLSDDELRLLVWIQGDGHYMRERRYETKEIDGDNRVIGLEFHLARQRKISRIIDLLNDLDIPYSISNCQNGTSHIRVYKRSLYLWAEEWLTGKGFNYNLLDMSQHQFEVFWEELRLVDGSVAGDLYCSLEHKNLDVVQAVCATHGMRTNITTLGNKDHKEVAVARALSNYTVGRGGSDASVTERNTVVSCVTVPTGYILIRQNNKTFIVGNCPSVPGWIPPTGSEAEWLRFKERIGASANPAPHNEPEPTPAPGNEFTSLSDADAVEKIGKLCTTDMAQSGILASISAAQFILESGYGRSELAVNANNYFGMKTQLSNNNWSGSTWDGVSVYTKETKEEDANGNSYTVKADFRKYATIGESISDHSAYLNGAKRGSILRYQGLKGCTDYTTAAKIIKNGGYATSVNYVAMLCDIIKRWNLTKFDIIKEEPIEVYRVRKSWDDVKSQIGAFSVLENAKAFADSHPGYAVFDMNGKQVYGGSGKRFLVYIDISNLRIRKGPGTNYGYNGYTGKGTFTIVETAAGPGSDLGWGKLLSGAGWISLDYCTMV